MNELTVVCWLWAGWRAIYGAVHVNALARMLREHLHMPHRLVCVTDRPDGIECETFPLWDDPHVATAPNKPNCYRRLKLFAREARDWFGPRVLSMDLDTLIVGDITPLISAHDFRICAGRSSPYNGSMWLLTAGTRTAVWDTFHPVRSPALIATLRQPGGTRYYGSDQAWISHVLPGEATWTEADGVHRFNARSLFEHRGVPDGARILFFPTDAKPWGERMRQRCPAIYERYMAYTSPANDIPH